MDLQPVPQASTLDSPCAVYRSQELSVWVAITVVGYEKAQVTTARSLPSPEGRFTCHVLQ